ncbi:MAG: hypothetical protein ACD_43C00138G0004 [uncultured bacterium]|nr:MAG: hypothetical protein ACD_43C00138G0004 [uncultured bacterium]
MPSAPTVTCQNCTQSFVVTTADNAFYQKIKVPAPTFCWQCRMQRRFSYRNERSLYAGICAKTGKAVITCFKPSSGITIYDRDIWWGDDWSATSFGQDYNWQQPFFTQFQALVQHVPFPAVFNNKCDNSAYCNHVGELKNCYLVFASWGGENSAYGEQILDVKDSCDVLGVGKSELVYDCLSSDQLYNVDFAHNAEHCHSAKFLFDCRGVSNCFGCTNLRNKSFYIFNQPYSEADYYTELKKYDTGSYRALELIKAKFAELKRQAIHRFAVITNSTNSSGDNLLYVNNTQYSFGTKNQVSDCKYVFNALEMTDVYDGYGVGAKAELLYEAMDSGVDGRMQLFVAVVWGSSNMYYSYNCFNCHDCFGCVGLRNAQYCLLNKPYSKEEYERLLPRLIEQMKAVPFTDKMGRTYRFGEYFPTELSPFAYNETAAQEYFPLTAAETQAQNWQWYNDDRSKNTATIAAADLPDHINEALDSITKETISCLHAGKCKEQCTTLYKIIPSELALLHKKNIALPRLCPNCRHYARLKQRYPLNLWQRRCQCPVQHKTHTPGQCPVEFQTTYNPDRSETVYCEKCYQAEVI